MGENVPTPSYVPCVRVTLWPTHAETEQKSFDPIFASPLENGLFQMGAFFRLVLPVKEHLGPNEPSGALNEKYTFAVLSYWDIISKTRESWLV